MFNVHPAQLKPEKLRSECTIRFQRRSGPGGQHRNKVETAVILLHNPTGVQSEASERRSQAENLAVALRRLRLKLAVEVRKKISEDQPSEQWKSRIRGGRICVNDQHDDFPALIAECLDVLEHHAWNLQEATARLGCSSSQVVRLLKDEPNAFKLLNQKRVEQGLKLLK